MPGENNNKLKKRRHHKYITLRQSLEPRLLFDATLVGPPQDHAVSADVDASAAAAAAGHSNASPTAGGASSVTPQNQSVTAPHADAHAAHNASEHQTPVTANNTSVSSDEKSATNNNGKDINKAITDPAAALQPTEQSSHDMMKDALQDFSNFQVQPKELVFIDSRIQNPESLLENISSTAEVHFINAGEDGINQMTAVIKSENSPISAVHILSHGESGSIEIGTSLLDEQALNSTYSSELSSWHSLLSPNANVLLYGCDVAQGSSGRQFVSDLSKTIGLGVAASIDTTGSTSLGGNWTLEYSVGNIAYSANSVFSDQSLNHYNYILGLAPVVNAGSVISYTEKASAAVLDSSLTITDLGASQLSSARVNIGNFVAGDALTFSKISGIAGSYNSATGVLTFTGKDSIAQYQSELRSVRFSSSSSDPTVHHTDVTRTVNWQVTDTLAATSVTATSAVNVTAVNDHPIVTAGATLAYTEKGSAAVIDNAIKISDADDTQMASAKVSIGNFVAGDTLSFTDTANITSAYDSSTGILTLTGTDSIANYQTALRSVQFSSSSSDPTVHNTDVTRTINWQVTDANASAVGAATSAAVTSKVHVTAVNDLPVVTAGASLAYTEKGSATVVDNSITISDADDTQMASAKVSISNFAAGDKLSFTNTANIKGSYNSATGVLTLTGKDSTANYQAALRSVQFNSSSSDPTIHNTDVARTINWQVTDANASAVGAATSAVATSTIHVTAINDPPVVTAGAILTYTEKGSAAVIDNAIKISDADDTQMESAKVSIGNFVAGDTLSFTDTANITSAYDSSTGILTLTGTDSIANYQAALRSVKFSSNSSDPTIHNTDVTRTINWQVTDANASAVGAATSATAMSTIHVKAVNDAPVVTAGATLAYTEKSSAVVIDNSITISDADDTQMASAKVSIGNFVAGDTLSFTNTATIKGSYNSSIGVLTLTGTDSVANYQAALRSVQFNSSSSDPTIHNTNVTRTINWQVTDANASAVGAATSAGVTSTVHVTAVNDAPIVTAGKTLIYTEKSSATVIDNSIKISDADDTQMASAKVSIGNFVAGDTLSFTDTANIKGSYNNSTGVLTLTGKDSTANYQAALRSVKFSSNSSDPTIHNTDVTRTINWQVTDANASAVGAATSAATTSTIQVKAVNDAPVMTAGSTLAYTERASAVVIDNSITISDADDTQMASATVSIGNFVAGDTLSFTNTANISGSYNSSTGVLTLTGKDSTANYQAALRSVQFSSSSFDPTVSDTKPTRTVSWQVTDANASAVGAATSANVMSIIDVTAINNPSSVTTATSAPISLAMTLPITPAALNNMNTSISAGIMNSNAAQVARLNQVAEWSWQPAPTFSNLKPVVIELNATVQSLRSFSESLNVNTSSLFLTNASATSQSNNTSWIDSFNISAKQTSSDINATIDQLNTNQDKTNDTQKQKISKISDNNTSPEMVRMNLANKITTFQQKMKQLLKDFGIL